MQKMPPSSIRGERQRRSASVFLVFLAGILTGLVVSLGLVLIAQWRQGNQAIFHWVAQLNKRWTNRATLPFAGRSASPYAVLQHVGRRSGQRYATPVVTAPVPDGFVIPLVYGDRSDWYRNLQTAGRGILQWQGNTYIVSAPKLVEMESVLAAFPRFWHWPLRLYGIHWCVWVVNESQRAQHLVAEKERQRLPRS